MSTRPGFWRRQFLLPPTRAQAAWDVLFGIALPLGCLTVDRILFGGNHRTFFDGSIFGPTQIFAYGFIVTQVTILAAWMLLRRWLTRSAAYFTGPLLAGWIFSLVVGLILLPFSVFGLLVVIGALGLSPWLTGFVYFRSWRMARALAPPSSRSRRFWLSIAGLAFAITPALALQVRAEYLIRRLGQASRFRLIPTAERVEAWAFEQDAERKVALSQTHERLIGLPIRPKTGLFGN
jgi:hypothetical protein